MAEQKKKSQPRGLDEEVSSSNEATLIRPPELLRALELEFGGDAPSANVPPKQIARPPRLPVPGPISPFPGKSPFPVASTTQGPRPAASPSTTPPPQKHVEEPTGTRGTLIMQRPVDPQMLEALKADVMRNAPAGPGPSRMATPQEMQRQTPGAMPAMPPKSPTAVTQPMPAVRQPAPAVAPAPATPRSPMPSEPPRGSVPPEPPRAQRPPMPSEPPRPSVSPEPPRAETTRPSTPAPASVARIVPTLPKNAGEWQQVWLAMQSRAWKSLVVISDGPTDALLSIASAIAAIGTEHMKRPIEVVDHRTVTLGDVESRIAALATTLATGARVIVVLDPIAKNPAGVRFATAVDAALLCLSLGKSELSVAKKTMDAIGKQRFLGVISLRSLAPPQATPAAKKANVPPAKPAAQAQPAKK